MSNFEREDQELAEMMGDKFVDETVPLGEMPEREMESMDIPKPKKAAEKPMDAQWHPTKQRTFMDDLKDITKSLAIFGGLNMLIWYWELAGLMDHSIALPCMWVCVFLAGSGVGKVLGIHKALRGMCR